jgi:hypothetical protein
LSGACIYKQLRVIVWQFGIILLTAVNRPTVNNQIKHFFYSNNIEILKGRRAEPYNPIWTISDLYLPIAGFYDRADHFSRSGGVRVGKNPECSIEALIDPLNDNDPYLLK